MKTNKPMRRGFTLVELLVVIVIIAALAGLSAPMVIRQQKKAAQTEAVNNARQIGLAMLEFEVEYATFPGAESLVLVTRNFPDAVALGVAGGDSNGFFKMLFQANLTKSEDMFYAKGDGIVKPDGNILTDADILSAGEVGFGYVTKGGTSGFSTSGNPSRPYIVAPLERGATTFDSGPYDGKAVILKVDNSVTSVNIRESDNTLLINGTNPLDAGNPIWDAEAPTVVPPVPFGS